MGRRRSRIILIVAAALAVVFSVLSGAAKPATVYKMLLATPLYEEATFGSDKVQDVVVKQNEEVELVGEKVVGADGKDWILVRYGGYYVGYVPYGYVYETVRYDEFTIRVSKATGHSTSDVINVYRLNDASSEVVATLTDGDTVNVIEDGVDYGAFLKISYGEYYYYVKSENVTTGLTYDQRLAVIIAGALIAGLLAVGVVVVLVVHKKRRGGKAN